MGTTEYAPGLRDRKRIKTRDTIRRAAVRLIAANGFTNTTVDQIAEAADIAPSTFFRYFPNKEAAVIADDLEQVALAALEAQPRGLSSLHAFRRAMEITAATVSEDGWEFERMRQRVVFSIPELRAAQFDTYRRSIGMLAEAENRRLGRNVDDLDARIFYGALAGALMAVLDRVRGPAQSHLLKALDFIEAGMPLT